MTFKKCQAELSLAFLSVRCAALNLAHNDKVTRRDGLRACPCQMRLMHERNSNDRKPILPDLPGNESYKPYFINL